MNHTSMIYRPHHCSFTSRGNGERRNLAASSPGCRRVEQNLMEGLVSVTGHHVEAMILHKFLYWTKRLWDFDQFMYEERVYVEQGIQGGLPESGWLEKTANDLRTELMLPMSGHAIRRHLKSLVRKGFLYEREDPVHPWEHTLQYRANLVRLQAALARRGYFLDEDVSE